VSAEQFAAVALVDSVWQSPLIALAAWLLLRVFLRTTAAVRHGTWLAALLACAVFPCLTAFRESGGATVGFPTALGIAEGVWAIIAFALLLRLAISIVFMGRVKRNALPLGPCHRATLTRWNCKSECARDLRLCVSADVESPCAVGLFDAMVVLPEWLLGNDSHGLDSIVIHELAHLRRYDDWTRLLQYVIASLLFFNPVVHWIVQQLELECEVACDDAAVACPADAPAYAACLAAVARDTAWLRTLATVPSFCGSRKALSIRVERLLETRKRRTSTAVQVAVLATIALVSVFCVCFALGPLASAAMGSAQDDDPSVHARALSIYEALREGRYADTRLDRAEEALAQIGAPYDLHLLDRTSTSTGYALRYRARAAHGEATIQIRTDSSGRVLGFTIAADGTDRRGRRITAYAYSSTGADLPVP
jgi:beta-lactamase regulating signal transducer with metallopeptidase domain